MTHHLGGRAEPETLAPGSDHLLSLHFTQLIEIFTSSELIRDWGSKVTYQALVN